MPQLKHALLSMWKTLSVLVLQLLIKQIIICLQKPQDIVACPSKLSTRISAGVDDGPYNHSDSDVICLADHY